VLAIQVGTLRDDESVQNRMMERRQFMHIDVGGFLAPTERGLRPQLLLQVVLAPIKRDNRHAIVNRGAEGVPKVLIYYP
jgi:hypothetical protein